MGTILKMVLREKIRLSKNRDKSSDGIIYTDRILYNMKAKSIVLESRVPTLKTMS